MNQPNPQFTQRSVQIKAPGPFVQILSMLILLAIIVIGFVIFIPLAIFIIALGLILFAYFKLKIFFKRAHDPNGPLDKRRNVRVVDRDSDRHG
jgi:hypothetical protein